MMSFLNGILIIYAIKNISVLPYNVGLVQFTSVAQVCSTCDLMDCSMPGYLVHHQLLELAQTHVHRVSDAIQLSHPLSFLSPPAFSLSQHQGLFQWVSFFASDGHNTGASASASVLPMNIWDWFPLGLTGLISLKSKGVSRVFSNTTVQKHQFFGTLSFVLLRFAHCFASQLI